MYEMLEIIPDIGVPLPSKYSYQDLKERVDAACNSAIFLTERGANYEEPTTEDKEIAADLAAQYAQDGAKDVKNEKIARMTPQSIIFAAGILGEYGHKVAESSAQIRNMVTTKLIHETENADPRVRLKALELLGKISDVGLFAEKTEVTVTHRTSDELKSVLKKKLERLINPESFVGTTPMPSIEAELENDPDLDFSDMIEAEYTEEGK